MGCCSSGFIAKPIGEWTWIIRSQGACVKHEVLSKQEKSEPVAGCPDWAGTQIDRDYRRDILRTLQKVVNEANLQIIAFDKSTGKNLITARIIQAKYRWIAVSFRGPLQIGSDTHSFLHLALLGMLGLSLIFTESTEIENLKP